MFRRIFVIVLLMMLLSEGYSSAQQVYNSCFQALELCPGQIFTVDNIGANETFCPGCEDDFTFCFSPSNSIWLTFTTNSAGGTVNVDFSNLIFDLSPGFGTDIQASILEASVPCNSASYTQIGNCESAGNAPFTLSGILAANTTYYVIVNGSSTGAGVTQPAECAMDVAISGPGVDRPVPTIDVTLSNSTACLNEVVTVSAALTDCTDTSSFSWYVNGVLSAVTTEAYFQSSSFSTGDIVSVETSCFSLCPVTITDAATPITIVSFTVDAGADINADYGDTVQLNGSTTATVFEWSPSFGVSATTALSPFVWPTTTTVYTLSGTQNGCTITDEVTVFIDPVLIFPNTFSPNDDGLNDKWEITGIELYPDCFVRIYDRWGQDVYQSTGYSSEKAWDGQAKSGKLSEGVYYYIVDLRDQSKQQFKGSITLIR